MNLLKFFLHNQITLSSNKKPDDVINLLSRHIASHNSFFDGYIDGKSFDITRRTGWYERNSCIPVIIGTVYENGNGSKIIITMRLHLLVCAFMIMWSCSILYIVLKSIIVNHNFVAMLVLCMGGPVLGLCWQIYDSECNKVISFMKRLL